MHAFSMGIPEGKGKVAFLFANSADCRKPDMLFSYFFISPVIIGSSGGLAVGEMRELKFSCELPH